MSTAERRLRVIGERSMSLRRVARWADWQRLQSGGGPLPQWTAPLSPHALCEERYAAEPFRLLVCCILLNLTTWRQVEPVASEIFRRWPTPGDLARANRAALVDVLRPLGLLRRAATLQRFSREFATATWSGEDVRKLHGVGEYAADAYGMFVLGRMRRRPPRDRYLRRDWLWFHEAGGERSARTVARSPFWASAGAGGAAEEGSAAPAASPARPPKRRRGGAGATSPFWERGRKTARIYGRNGEAGELWRERQGDLSPAPAARSAA